MLSRSEQAIMNLEQARDLRAAGLSYREIRSKLSLAPSQLRRIRRILSRAKATQTRLRSLKPDATEIDIPVAGSVLPLGLRQLLKQSGYVTLGDLAKAFADPDFKGLETLPHRARLVKGLLDHFALLPGAEDLQGAVETLFPELRDSGQL